MPIVVLPLVLIALVMLVLWFCGTQLHMPAFQGVGHLGGTLGGLMLNWFIAGIEWAIGQAEHLVQDAVAGLLGLISVPIHWLQEHFDQLANGIFGAYTSILNLSMVTIPRAISGALSTARAWMNEAEQYASSLVTHTVTWVQSQFTAVYSYVNSEISLAEGYTRTLVSAAEAYTAQGLAADEKYATGLFTSAIGYTDHALTGVEGWVTGELGTVTAWTGTQIGALQGWTEANLAGITAWTSTLVGTVELDLTRLKEDCTDNLCSNLGPLANVINALGGDLGLAAVIALAGEFAHDPEGTAREVINVFKPVADAAADTMRAAAGF